MSTILPPDASANRWPTPTCKLRWMAMPSGGCSVRQEAFASLADPQGLRQRAHAVRAEVIAHLDALPGAVHPAGAGQWDDRAPGRGCRAGGADRAGDRPASIGAQLIAKSKTMVSEEIELNHALEAAGLRVVETDLGEYIVQLRGERPRTSSPRPCTCAAADVGQTLPGEAGRALHRGYPDHDRPRPGGCCGRSS